MSKRDDVLRRVRALLAKEGAEGTTPEEVAASLALAQRLLEREGLTRESLALGGSADAEPEEDMVKCPDPLEGTGGKLAVWKNYLGVILTKENGCAGYRGPDGLILIGRPSDIQVIRYLFAYCAREIDRLAKAYCKGCGATYANNFRLGCVDAIAKAIKTQKDAERAAQRAVVTGSALLVLDRAIIAMDQRAKDADAFMRTGVRLRTRTAASVRGDAGARAAGRAAGASIYPGGAPGKSIAGGNLRLKA